MKPDVYDAVRPVFALFDAAGSFGWHENLDPSDHNYQLDNRMAAYRFIARHFSLKAPEREQPAELLSYEEMSVGVPKDNLTIVELARRLTANRKEGGDLRAILRYQPVAVARAWPVHNTKQKGLETFSYRIDFANGLSATAVWLRAIAAQPDAPATSSSTTKARLRPAPKCPIASIAARTCSRSTCFCMATRPRRSPAPITTPKCSQRSASVHWGCRQLS